MWRHLCQRMTDCFVSVRRWRSELGVWLLSELQMQDDDEEEEDDDARYLPYRERSALEEQQLEQQRQQVITDPISIQILCSRG